jgi:hypothetical protein
MYMKVCLFGKMQVLMCLGLTLPLIGCTVKAVGDPQRPITINANITIDIKGLKETATNIEDYVAGQAAPEDLKLKGGVK